MPRTTRATSAAPGTPQKPPPNYVYTYVSPSPSPPPSLPPSPLAKAQVVKDGYHPEFTDPNWDMTVLLPSGFKVKFLQAHLASASESCRAKVAGMDGHKVVQFDDTEEEEMTVLFLKVVGKKTMIMDVQPDKLISLFEFATRHGASTLSEQTLLAMCADPSYLSSNAPTIFGLAVLSKQYKIAYTALCAFTATVVDIQPSPVKSSARGKQPSVGGSTHVVVVTEEHMLRDIPREMWDKMTREFGDRLNEVQAEVMRMRKAWGQVISPEQLKDLIDGKPVDFGFDKADEQDEQELHVLASAKGTPVKAKQPKSRTSTPVRAAR